MKKNLKKWFSKKDKTEGSEETTTPQENYTAMASNSLYNLPATELVAIIFKFDLEVKNLNKDLQSTKDQLSSTKQDYSKLQDQSTLYKQHNEALQSECNKLVIDLNEAATSLDTKQESINLLTNQVNSKDEMLSSYKIKLQELEKSLLDLQFTGINFDAGEEIIKLKAKLEESSKSSDEINELKIKNKMQEGEISKLSQNLSESKEQMRMWKDKVNIFEKDRKEIEADINRKKIEIENLNSQVNKMNFLKESYDTEIKALKESINNKDIKFTKKNTKIENLHEQNVELQKAHSVLKFELDSLKIKQQEELIASQEKFVLDKEESLARLNQKIIDLELEIQELNKTNENSTNLQSEILHLQKITQDQQERLSITLAELHEKTLKINSLEIENQKIAERLKRSENKRELARNEIIKLTQKIESTTAPIIENKLKNEANFNIDINSSPKELDLVNLLKNELENIYKTLMKISYINDSVYYQIKIEDFSSFENKLNNIVMQLHEQLDERSQEQSLNINQKNTISKPVGRLPIKIFSCIADQDEAPPRLIPKPKRPIQQQTDNRLVFRRGSAN